MPWTCPACRSQIHHSAVEDRPRPNVIYRCAVCRLELTLDRDTNRLNVVPLPENDPAERDRRAT